jgi:hypothetical protein
VALLDSIRDEFTDRNVPMHLLLGMLSLTRRLDAVLGPRDAPMDRREPSPRDDASCLHVDAEPMGKMQGETPPRGDAFLHLLLGLISLRRTLRDELDPIRAAPRGAALQHERGTPGPVPPAQGLRDLLR